MSEQKVVSDMTRVQPDGALSRGVEQGHWRVCDYRCADLEGKLIYADLHADAPQLTLPLGLEGWHRVSIGLQGPGGPRGTVARVKLTGDRCFRTLMRWRPALETIEDLFVTCADLTGRDLVIAPPAPGTSTASSLAYVRCQPLCSSEVQKLQAERARPDRRRVIAYNDGLSSAQTDLRVWSVPVTHKQRIFDAQEYPKHMVHWPG